MSPRVVLSTYTGLWGLTGQGCVFWAVTGLWWLTGSPESCPCRSPAWGPRLCRAPPLLQLTAAAGPDRTPLRVGDFHLLRLCWLCMWPSELSFTSLYWVPVYTCTLCQTPRCVFCLPCVKHSLSATCHPQFKTDAPAHCSPYSPPLCLALDGGSVPGSVLVWCAVEGRVRRSSELLSSVQHYVFMRQFQLGFATCCFSLHPSHSTYHVSPAHA